MTIATNGVEAGDGGMPSPGRGLAPIAVRC